MKIIPFREFVRGVKDPCKNTILKPKILEVVLHLPCLNEKFLHTCILFETPEEGIRTVHMDPMRIWGPHKSLQIRFQESGYVPVRIDFNLIRGSGLNFVILMILTGPDLRILSLFYVSFSNFDENSLHGFNKRFWIRTIFHAIPDFLNL